MINQIEFDEVLKALNINNNINKNGEYGTSKAIYFWNNITIYFEMYEAVIRGKVPLEVANIIYEKYHNSHYGIRIDNGSSDYIPIEHAIDDQYKKEIQEYGQNLNTYEYLARCENSKINMLKRNNENKYIETYHIDSKEGLVILLTELKDYYARKQGLPETEVRRYDEIMSTIIAGILKAVNPAITAYDWMSADEQYGQSFLNAITKEKQIPLKHTFRKIVDQFDRTINPYINEDIELDSIDNYLQKVNIIAHNEIDDKYKRNCCSLRIKTKEGENNVEFGRSLNGFYYILHCTLASKEGLRVSHYFDTEGEIICINYFEENSKQKTNLKYNITKDLCDENHKGKMPITFEQLLLIYNKLTRAIELASKITIDNMKKKEYSKKLVPDKK